MGAVCAKKLSIILSLALFAAKTSAEPIRIAYSGVGLGRTGRLAKEEGIFPSIGFEADLVAVRSAPLQVTRAGLQRGSVCTVAARLAC